MGSLKFLYFCYFACALASCDKKEKFTQETAIASDSISVDTAAHNKKLAAVLPEQQVTNIIFNEFTVTLDCAKDFGQQNLDSLQQQDSITVNLDIGETAEGQKLSIKSNNPGMFTVEQRYETSAGISFEGPYCEISNWKHYYSAWEVLNPGNDGTYICKDYTLSESVKFPDVTIEELKTAVLKNCGEEGFKLIKDIKKVGEGSCEVGISRIFLRITLSQQNGQKTTKIITLNIPAGC